MFATTAGYQSESKYRIICNKNDSKLYSYSFGYPFNFKAYPGPCVADNATNLAVTEYPGGKASFFVAIGVLAMLYCIVMIIWYVFFEVKFIKLDLFPVADLVLTAVFALFFFLASCAWASGVTTVKYWTSFDTIKKQIYPGICSNPLHQCSNAGDASYSSLNASVLFGFLNFLVWLGNCWFVYKETTWFKSKQNPEQKQPETKQEVPPNDI